jgi:hypothetical protein
VQQVRLMDSAGPHLNGDHAVTLEFMADATPGTRDASCHTVTLGTLPLVVGYASLDIPGVPSSCFTTDRWIAITVIVQDILPHLPIHHVPTAGVAGRVPTAGSPSGCTSAGAIVHNTVAGNLLVCDGSAWAAVSGTGDTFPTGNWGSSSCPVTGDVRRTDNEFQGYDAVSWLVLAQAGTFTTPGPVTFVGTAGDQPFWVSHAGGGGGAGGWTFGYCEGGGGLVTGTVAVTPGEVLTVMVGTGGQYNVPHGSSPNYGGGGGLRCNAHDNEYGGSDGGRSALRRATHELLTAGGDGNASGGWAEGFRGGACGYTTAYMTVTPGETLTMMVGQGGAYPFPDGGNKNYGGGGGWGASVDNRYGASGGGRSAVRDSAEWKTIPVASRARAETGVTYR